MISITNVIYNYYKTTKNFPSALWLADKVGITKEHAQKYLDKLNTKESKVPINKAPKKIIIKAVTPKIKTLVKPRPLKPVTSSWSMTIIKIVMLVISIVSIFISVYYSSVWLQNFLAPFQAWVWGFTMVLYSVFAFQCVVKFWKDKKLIAIVMMVTAVIMTVFSIVSTIAGQYKSNDIDNVRTTNIQISMLKTEEKDLNESKDNMQVEIKMHQKNLTQFDKNEMETKEYKVLFWKLNDLRMRKRKYEKRLEALRKEILSFYSKGGAVVKKDFYSWIAEFLPFQPDNIEFWLYMFPAVFVDIMAPLGMMIFLNKFKEKT